MGCGSPRPAGCGERDGVVVIVAVVSAVVAEVVGAAGCLQQADIYAGIRRAGAFAGAIGFRCGCVKGQVNRSSGAGGGNSGAAGGANILSPIHFSILFVALIVYVILFFFLGYNLFILKVTKVTLNLLVWLPAVGRIV